LTTFIIRRLQRKLKKREEKNEGKSESKEGKLKLHQIFDQQDRLGTSEIVSSIIDRQMVRPKQTSANSFL
jgi:hypothetical protein